MKQQIVAAGGGGFRMEPDNLALERYILAQSGKELPKVCFIPTASAESDNYVVSFYSAYNKLDCVPSHLSLFHQPTNDLEDYVLSKDVIHVGGGNTRCMLALWREWGLDKILRKAWEQGIVLSGVSAGCICWFEQGVTDSNPGKLSAMDCLGFLKGSCCPHYDGEAQRQPRTHELLLSGELMPGYALGDGVAMHFIGTKLHKTVSSRVKSVGYKLTKKSRKVIKTALEIEYLEDLIG